MRSSTSKNSSGILKIKTRTWEKDSYGLFDFDAKEITSNKFEIERPFTLVREKNKITLENRSKELELKNEKLCSISKEKGEFYIQNWRENIDSNFNAKDLWMVIGSKRFESKSSFLLNEGDVFKVGRMAFRVLQVFFPLYFKVAFLKRLETAPIKK